MRFLRQSLKLQILRLFQARSSLTFRQLFTLKRLSDMIITYCQMHHSGKFSKHSPIIWPVWLNDWMFAYKLSGCGFEFYCSLFFICDIFIIWIWGTQVHIPIQIWFLKVSSRPEIPDVFLKSMVKLSKAYLYEYSRPLFKFFWLRIFPWIKLSWHSCSMWDKPGWTQLNLAISLWEVIFL